MRHLQALLVAIIVAAGGVHSGRRVARSGRRLRIHRRFGVNSPAVFFSTWTVLDKKDHPVVSGLTKDDFTITEDKKPQPYLFV